MLKCKKCGSEKMTRNGFVKKNSVSIVKIAGIILLSETNAQTTK